MNVQQYRDRLVGLEKTLSARIYRDVAEGREQFIESAHDVGEAGVADEAASEKFADADRDGRVLRQIREALVRVDAGTFGACVVDGGPIEEKRLEAVPWTAHCLKHERLLERSAASTGNP